MAPSKRIDIIGMTLISLMILSVLAPLNYSGIASSEPSGNEVANGLILPDTGKTYNTGGRAPCPLVQNDGGTTGDAGNTTATAKMLGTDPTVSNSPGCIDATDTDDWYNITLSNNHRIDVDLVGPVGTDFDLMLHDGTYYYDYSAGADSNESVSFSTNSTNGGVYFIAVMHYSGDGNYDIDVVTTDLSSVPDLFVSNVSGPQNATAGDVVTLDYNISNVGAGDYVASSSDPILVTGWLSTNDIISTFDDEMDGNSTVPSISAGQVIASSLTVTIPVDQATGTYYWGIMVDVDDDLVELSETNNSAASDLAANITTTPCPLIDDAGTGTDVGDTKGDAFDLGDQFTGVITGCLNSDDTSDFYEIHVHRNQNISAYLTMDSEVDFDLILWNQTQSAALATSFNSTVGHHENVTNAGTDSDLTEGDYVLEVRHWSGTGNYTLEVWVNGTAWVPPYDCGPDSDWGQTSYDAGSSGSTAYDVGNNPESMGRGCMDPSDTIDAYRFTLSGMQGTTIELESDNATDMSIELYHTENGVEQLISEGQITDTAVSVDTSSIPVEELGGNYFILITADEPGVEWESGWYNLTFTPIAAPLPDLVAEPATCPLTAETTGYSAPFVAQVSSMGGPMDATLFAWELTLVDEGGNVAMTLLQGSHNDALSGNDGIVDQDGAQVLLTDDLSSGYYTCVLTVDGGDVIAESNETNNVWTSLPFEIINEEELYADDVDRDGVPNDLDGCPNTPGDSTIDRLGCQDADGDGYSNGGDVFIYEPTQWNDTDGDLFGDNNGPDDYNGDDCPNEPGVASGTNGTGCPIWNPDADGDGIPDTSDQCADTPAGATTNLVGCSDIDGDGVFEPTDLCPETPAGTSVDDTGCAITSGDGNGDGSGDSGDSGDAEGTTDGGSNTLLYIIIAASVVMLIVVVLGATVLLRGGGNSDPTEQAWATAISPEQQAYEQQLIGMGYTAEQARAYASQYFQQ